MMKNFLSFLKNLLKYLKLKGEGGFNEKN